MSKLLEMTISNHLPDWELQEEYKSVTEFLSADFEKGYKDIWIEIWNEVRSGDLAKFPHKFWAGYTDSKTKIR